MTKDITNIASSIRNRLIKIAEETNKDYNALLRLYFQERFLYRLSISPFKKKLVLKGALLLMSKDISKFRPTRDIDFLGRKMPNDVNECSEIIAGIAAIEFNDGVYFESKLLRSEIIKEESEYEGVRIHLPYRMDSIKSNISIDIAFGDKITEGPVEIDFPILLDQPRPHIFVYSFESAIAEKFEAIVKLNFLTSRMKDFYDILFMASKNTFKKSSLKLALKTTFNNRETNLDDRTFIYTDKYINDKTKNTQWNAFFVKNRLEQIFPFSEAIGKLQQFIEPALSEDKLNEWNSNDWSWH